VRKLLVLAAIVMCVALVTGPAFSAGTVRLVINATEVRPDVPPQNISGRVLVPIRVISENLGFDVVWHQEIQTVTVNHKGEAFPIPQVTPGSVHLVIDGVEVHPDVPPQNVGGRIMVPIRVVSQAFDLEVNWHQDAQMVTVGPLGPVIEVHFIDVGQADCILVKLPKGENILVDGGNDADADTVLAYLAAEKVTSLDYVVATHPHDDHLGGLAEVIEALPVGVVILPRQASESDAYVHLLATIQAERLHLEYADRVWKLVQDGAVAVDVLGPTKATYSDPNDCSVVLRVSNGSMDFLLTGDAGVEAENDVLSTGFPVDAEVLKVGYHGNGASTTAQFLAEVDPDYAVISVGEGNAYGLPAARTLAALSAAGVTVYRTDLDGTIVATATENSVWFDTEKGSGGIEDTDGTGDSSQTTVYVTETGTKYHRAGCSYLSHSSISIALAEAKAAGYTPCSKCHPPR